jgi:hypothetical protein
LISTEICYREKTNANHQIARSQLASQLPSQVTQTQDLFDPPQTQKEENCDTKFFLLLLKYFIIQLNLRRSQKSTASKGILQTSTIPSSQSSTAVLNEKFSTS